MNAAARNNLPALTGTKAQVAWAEDLRVKMLDGIDRNIKNATFETRRRQFENTRDYLLTKTTAKWWIDNRNSFNKPTTVHIRKNIEVLKALANVFGTSANFRYLRVEEL